MRPLELAASTTAEVRVRSERMTGTFSAVLASERGGRVRPQRPEQRRRPPHEVLRIGGHARLIAACDYAFIPEGSAIRWPVSAPLPGARSRRRTNPLTVRLRPAQLEELGICRKYADLGAVSEFLKRLVDGLSGVSGRSVQILRLATRTGHGGHDLSRVPNSLAVRWHTGHA